MNSKFEQALSEFNCIPHFTNFNIEDVQFDHELYWLIVRGANCLESVDNFEEWYKEAKETKCQLKRKKNFG